MELKTKKIRATIGAALAVGLFAVGLYGGQAHAVSETSGSAVSEKSGNTAPVIEATLAPKGVAPRVDYCAGDTPATNTWVTVCVEGHLIWVKDGEADGQSAWGDYINPSGSDFPACRNSQGSGTWAYCYYDRIGNNQLVNYEAWTRNGGGTEKNHRTTGSGFVRY